MDDHLVCGWLRVAVVFLSLLFLDSVVFTPASIAVGVGFVLSRCVFSNISRTMTRLTMGADETTLSWDIFLSFTVAVIPLPPIEFLPFTHHEYAQSTYRTNTEFPSFPSFHSLSYNLMFPTASIHLFYSTTMAKCGLAGLYTYTYTIHIHIILGVFIVYCVYEKSCNGYSCTVYLHAEGRLFAIELSSKMGVDGSRRSVGTWDEF